MITKEVEDFVKNSPSFQATKGVVDVCKTMAEITIYTASRSLQGKEVRDKFDSTFAELYHDLDMGFAPINFMLPWAPLPHNRKRDAAQRKMTETYMDIIKERRKSGSEKDSQDMVWNLMSCVYKNGNPVPDEEVAHMMIALLMAGQHSSSSTAAWIVLHLATRPDIMEELYREQLRVLGPSLPELTYDNLQKLDLHAKVIKETLRIHSPIHSIIRAVKNPMPVEGTPYVIPTSHNVLSSPGVTARSDEHFGKPSKWNPHRWDQALAADTEDEEQIDYGYGLVNKGTNSPYLPFGAGRHRCIGEQFAYVQLGAITAALVRLFKFQNLPGVQDIPNTDYSVSWIFITQFVQFMSLGGANHGTSRYFQSLRANQSYNTKNANLVSRHNQKPFLLPRAMFDVSSSSSSSSLFPWLHWAFIFRTQQIMAGAGAGAGPQRSSIESRDIVVAVWPRIISS